MNKIGAETICSDYCSITSHEDQEAITHLLNEMVTVSADPNLSFDMILIDEIHRWELIHFVLETLTEKLRPNGNFLVTNTRPMYPSEAGYPPHSDTFSPFWLGDAWKVRILSSLSCLSSLFIVDPLVPISSEF
jgi:hypothetical protein